MLTETIEDEWSGKEDCEVINFTLDGITYSAVEDPVDGYRSCMRDLKKSDKVTSNTFLGVKVSCEMIPDDNYGSNDVLHINDIETGKLIIAVGTENSDDYYPSFVSTYHPENMAINKDKK